MSRTQRLRSVPQDAEMAIQRFRATRCPRERVALTELLAELGVHAPIRLSQSAVRCRRGVRLRTENRSRRSRGWA